jgi:hypothetical protein
MFRVVLLLLLATGALRAREFDPKRDGFAFANETVLAYGVDEDGQLHMGKKEAPAAFAHRCIAMVRGAMQFWKFARFEPTSPNTTPAEYRKKLRHLFRIPVWFGARSDARRIVFPGYPDLWSFSRAQTRLVQEEIGAWLPTYLRVGNWRMPCPATRFFQAWTASALAKAVPQQPQAVFLAKWSSMNHVVLAYRVEQLPGGDTRFWVYDPNYPGQPTRMDYRRSKQLFDFEPRFYWPGGFARAFRIYLSPIH